MNSNSNINISTINDIDINATDEQKYMKTTTYKLFGHSYEIKHKKHNNVTNPFIVYPSICFHILDKKIKNKKFKQLMTDVFEIALALSIILSVMSAMVGVLIEQVRVGECERAKGDCSVLINTFNIEGVEECNAIVEKFNINGNIRYSYVDCFTKKIKIWRLMLVGCIALIQIVLFVFIRVLTLYVISTIAFTIIYKIYDIVSHKINDEMPEVNESIV
jgi:hypothetical protein